MKVRRLQLIRTRPFFTWLAKTPTLFVDTLIVCFTLNQLLSRTTVTKKWTWLHIIPWITTFWRLPQKRLWFLLGKPIHSKAFLTKLKVVGTASAMNRNSTFIEAHMRTPSWYQQHHLKKEHSKKASELYLLRLWILVVYMLGQSKQELSRWYPLNSNRFFQRPLCTSYWFDFKARCYWTLLLPKTSWGTAKSGTKRNLAPRTRCWTHCNGMTDVFGCSWQCWRCWKEFIKWTTLLSGKMLMMSFYSKIGSLARFLQVDYQLLPMRLSPLQRRHPAVCTFWALDKDWKFI